MFTLPRPNDHSMIQDAIEKLAGAIRDVPDFPKPGIIFKDITPLLGNPELFSLIGDVLADPFRDTQVDKVVGIDARGFIFATQVAERLNAGFVPIRKKGKLPFKTKARSLRSGVWARRYGNSCGCSRTRAEGSHY